MKKHKIEIEYCTKCKWLLRSAWIAQELLSTFEEEIQEISLIPGKDGIFEVRSGVDVIWSLNEMGRFPDIKELKKLLRDRISPGRNLGHIDK